MACLPVWAGLGAWLVKVDEDPRVAKRASASITGSDTLAREADGVSLNHLDGSERLRLEAHIDLFEAGALHGILPRVLAIRPGCWEVGRLLGGDVWRRVRLCYWTHRLGLRRGRRVGRGRCVDRAEEEAIGSTRDGASVKCTAGGKGRYGGVATYKHGDFLASV